VNVSVPTLAATVIAQERPPVDAVQFGEPLVTSATVAGDGAAPASVSTIETDFVFVETYCGARACVLALGISIEKTALERCGVRGGIGPFATAGIVLLPPEHPAARAAAIAAASKVDCRLFICRCLIESECWWWLR
jgi:hypothetical protein